MTETTKTRTLFAPEELQPQSGFPTPSRCAETLAALGPWNEALRSIYVHNPNHRSVLAALDTVMALGTGKDRYAVRNSAVSYAGKSAAADAFARIIRDRSTHPADSRPVVRVELEQACTSRRFWETILHAYGDGFTSKKDENGLRRSAYEAFERHGTALLIVDEIQHAGYRSQGSSAATDVIKRFISDGQVGIGLFGNEHARELLVANNQLSHRMLPPCDIKPLDLSDTKQQKTFGTFLRKYDEALRAKRLFTESSNLHDARTAACLMAVSSGYLGRTVALLQVAARHAFQRKAGRIDVHDLSHATSTWAVEQKLTASDPFRFGIAKSNA